jgi:hypothetical protein
MSSEGDLFSVWIGTHRSLIAGIDLAYAPGSYLNQGSR